MKHFFILLYFKKDYLYIQKIGKEKGKKGKERKTREGNLQ